MGHIAKADGRVTERAIQAARTTMEYLQLSEREIAYAIELFTDGKRADFPLDAVLCQLHALCRDRQDLRRAFIQMQIQAALWAGALNATSRRLLQRMCRALDLRTYELVCIEALLRLRSSSAAPRVPQRVTAAYALLAVPATASDTEVVKAYRRLMNQHHPDKLMARDASPVAVAAAQEKTRRIRRAYEIVRDARGLK